MGLAGVQASSSKQQASIRHQAASIKHQAASIKKLGSETLARNTKNPLSYKNAKIFISCSFEEFGPIFKFTEN